MAQLGNQQARIQRQPEAIPHILSFKRKVHTRPGVMDKMRIHVLTPTEGKWPAQGWVNLVYWSPDHCLFHCAQARLLLGVWWGRMERKRQEEVENPGEGGLQGRILSDLEPWTGCWTLRTLQHSDNAEPYSISDSGIPQHLSRAHWCWNDSWYFCSGNSTRLGMRMDFLNWDPNYVAQMVKHLLTMRESRVQSLVWEEPLEKEMATHSSTLAWKIPWMEEPGRL